MFISDSQYILQAWLRNLLLRAMLVVLCLVSTSCDDQDQIPSSTSLVRVNVDWSSCADGAPAGMTVLFHHSETGDHISVIDNDVSGVTHGLKVGRYWATVFSLTERELENICLRGLDNVETAEAYLRHHPGSKWYKTADCDGNYLAGEPEWFAVDTIMTSVVTGHPEGNQPCVIGMLRPHDIVHTLHVTIHIDNINYLLSARGAITGFASGRHLSADTTNDNALTVTHLIESDSWTCSRSYSSYKGIVKADIRCFGLPSGHGGTPHENMLEFQVLLADGKTVKRYMIPVGDLIKKSTEATDNRSDGLDLALELWLDSPLPPCNGGGGIDVWFDDWDESADFNMPV